MTQELLVFGACVAQMFFSMTLVTRVKGVKFHLKLVGILALLVQSINILYWRLAKLFPILMIKPLDLKVTVLGFDYGLNTVVALLLAILLTKLCVRGYRVVKEKTKEEVKVSTAISMKSSFLVSFWNVIAFPLIVSYLLL